MTEPVALKEGAGVVLPFSIQKLDHSRVTSADLVRRRPLVVRQVVTTVLLNRAIDQPSEVIRCRGDAVGRVIHMEIEDDTRPGFAGPRQNTFLISFNQSNRAVDNVE